MGMTLEDAQRLGLRVEEPRVRADLQDAMEAARQRRGGANPATDVQRRPPLDAEEKRAFTAMLRPENNRGPEKQPRPGNTTDAAKNNRGAETAATERRAWWFVVPGRPVGKARARVTAHGTYTPKATRDYEQAVYLAARAAGVRVGAGPVAIDVRLWPPDRRRWDVDNVLKAALDGLARPPVMDGDHWAIVRKASVAVVAIDAENPRTEVMVRIIAPDPVQPAAQRRGAKE